MDQINSVFDFTVKTLNGSDLNLSDYEGKVLLIVNTASKCGFTPQYDGLENLHKEYGPKGLVVLGFPCNQFANQESGNSEEIASFCKLNFGVTFPLMAKVNVNGSNTHPIYKFLKKKAPGVMGGTVKWNFTKFLVSRNGTEVQRFAPTVEPKDLKDVIERELTR